MVVAGRIMIDLQILSHLPGIPGSAPAYTPPPLKTSLYFKIRIPLASRDTVGMQPNRPICAPWNAGTDGPSRRSLHSRDVVSCGAVFNRYRHSEDGQVQPDQADHVRQVPETLLGGLHQAGPLYARVVPRLRGWKWALRQER